MFFRKDKNQDENKDGRSSAYRLINQSSFYRKYNLVVLFL